MFFFIERIQIELEEDQYGLRLTAFNESLPLPGQTLEETTATVTKNFYIAVSNYKERTDDIIPIADLYEVCLKKVLHYFYLYNSWRTLYEKEKNRSRELVEKDFSHPNTNDKIIQYLNIKMPQNILINASLCVVLKKRRY